MATLGVVRMLYSYSDVGSAVLVSTTMGDSQEPQDVKRATMQGFTSFLCPDRENAITSWLSEARYPPDLIWEWHGADR